MLISQINVLTILGTKETGVYLKTVELESELTLLEYP